MEAGVRSNISFKYAVPAVFAFVRTCLLKLRLIGEVIFAEPAKFINIFGFEDETSSSLCFLFVPAATADISDRFSSSMYADSSAPKQS